MGGIKKIGVQADGSQYLSSQQSIFLRQTQFCSSNVGAQPLNHIGTFRNSHWGKMSNVLNQNTKCFLRNTNAERSDDKYMGIWGSKWFNDFPAIYKIISSLAYRIVSHINPLASYL